MEKWPEIRFRHEREGESKRAIIRETGIHWTTLEKILSAEKAIQCHPGEKTTLGPPLSFASIPSGNVSWHYHKPDCVNG
jgi:hypothetical protein